jgi:hypothetical protein
MSPPVALGESAFETKNNLPRFLNQDDEKTRLMTIAGLAARNIQRVR